MYQVLARKWRPRNFEELVGQPHVARTLSNAVRSGRLAHAYIFAGLRGTGKTTVARILAKCLDCTTGPTTTPCDECAACREIAESRSLDVLEIDAASRTKVEQTRELLELVSYAPVRDRYKVLIIDEAHMLSKASFNALLKTLEEPPPNVLFVLATTELQKLLPTIVSRCQVFEFRRVPPAEVASHLRKVCDAEKVRISDAALDRIARAGEGSVRDSLSVLERVLAFCGDAVADEDVLRLLGAVRTEVLAALIGALARRDAGGMLGVLDGWLDEGHDLLHFWNELVSALRDLLLLRTLDGRADLLSRPGDEVAALEHAAGELSREDLLRAFQLVADLEPALKSSSRPRFLFEGALIRLAALGAVRPIELLLESLGGAAPEAEVPRLGPTVRQKKKHLEDDSGAGAGTVDAAARVLDAVREARPLVGAILERASSVKLDQGTLRVDFDSGSDALRRQLERQGGIELLRREAERVLGSPCSIRVGTVNDEDQPEAPMAPVPHAFAQSDAGRGDTPASRPPARRRAPTPAAGLLEEVRREPGVRTLLDAFGAQVVDIRSLGAVDSAVEGEPTGPVEEVP